jgi:hypothetical protein
MGSFLNVLGGAVGGFLTGGPIGAAAGAVGGAVSGGGPSGAGNITATNNPALAIQQQMDTADEYNQLALNAENMQHNDQMQWQSTMFNEMMDEKSEQMREMNSLRDVSMAQRKADNGIVKEFIGTIKD